MSRARTPGSHPPPPTTCDYDDALPDQVLVADSGVTVVVRGDPEPTWDVARPPPQTVAERDAIVREIEREHGAFLHRVACREVKSLRGEVVEESTRDLEQRVKLVLTQQIVDEGVPRNVRGFLTKAARNEALNYSRRWRLDVDHGADADAEVDEAPDPEEAVEDAEQRARLERHLGRIPEHLAAAFRCIAFRGMSYEAAAGELGRPMGTVAAHVTRARAKLKELVAESDREVELGHRRTPPTKKR